MGVRYSPATVYFGLLPVFFLQMRERICQLGIAQTVESHTLEKDGQATVGKLC